MKQPNEVPEGATHWCEGGKYSQPGWYKLDTNGWWFQHHDGKHWLESEAPLIRDIQRIMLSDHSVDATDMVGQKHDSGKPMMSLVPPAALLEVAKVMTFGANKYSPSNWKHVDDLHRRYTDAALRHINAYQRGEKLDDESGLLHMAHAICCLMFMLETDLNDELGN